ncbi:hypothetical protein CI610_01495 [invertebrate metagenome]|uniref:DUF2062 domain-containing protein n=1 Tax=invertebrate metagenome TaxID=1711999 RepID=A0A2H9T8K3_9ZZZZ
MVNQLLQRFMPSRSALQKHRLLRFFGNSIHHKSLWYINRRSVSYAVFIGVFCGCLPIPFQMVLATAIAIALQSNLPLSVGLVWISNPVTMPAIFYFTYKVGCYILNIPVGTGLPEFTLQGIGAGLVHIWKPLCIGSLSTGVIVGLLSFVATRLYWRWMIIRHWKKRRLHAIQAN